MRTSMMPVNTLVIGAGSFKFGDYTKVGVTLILAGKYFLPGKYEFKGYPLADNHNDRL
jgi:hypothetical protein